MTTPFQTFPPASMLLSPRVTLTGAPGASVQGINTTPIADGALVYCGQSATTFRLDKADGTTPPDGTTVIQPAAGPGRWKLFGAGGASALAPFTVLKYVDVGTLVPTLQQDGSVGKPYATVQQAIDASSGQFVWVQLASATNPSAISVPTGKFLTVIGAVGATVGAVTVADGGVYFFETTALASLTTGGAVGGIAFGAVTGASVLGDQSILDLVNSSLTGGVTLGNQCLLTGDSGVTTLGAIGVSDPANIGNIILMASASQSTGGGGETVRCLVTGVVNTPKYGLTATGYSFAQDVTTFTARLGSCSTLGNVTTTSTDATTDTLHVENPIGIANAAWTTAGKATLKGCETPGGGFSINNAVGKPLVVDSYTNYWLKTHAVPLASAVDKVVAADNTP